MTTQESRSLEVERNSRVYASPLPPMNGRGASVATKRAVPTRSLGVSRQFDPDGQLLAALRRRDGTAAECLVARYGDRAYRLAIGITRNAQDAEEAVQDALWGVIRKIDTFRGDSALGSWIYRIVANAAYQKLRGRARRGHEISLHEVLASDHEDGWLGHPIGDWSATIVDPALQAELRAALDSAMSELPAHYRAVLLLHDVEGLSMTEVASALGLTIPTAKTRAHRARLFLRQRLSMLMAGPADSVGVRPSREGCASPPPFFPGSEARPFELSSGGVFNPHFRFER